MDRGSSVSIPTRYGLDGLGIESRWGEIFRTRPDRPWFPPNLLYNEYRVFPGGKAAGAWRWPPTTSSAEFKERVELFLYSPFGPSWPVIGRTFNFTLQVIFLIHLVADILQFQNFKLEIYRSVIENQRLWKIWYRRSILRNPATSDARFLLQ